MRNRRLLFLAFLFLLFFDPPGARLLDPDETRYAEIPREMLASGDFLTPRLNGSPYFQKPPLLYWANAASLAAFGRNPFAARLPTRLSAIGTAALLVAAVPGSLTPGLALWSAAGTGAWAALIYLSAALSFFLGRFNLVDGLLTFTLTLSFLALRDFLLRREAGLTARRPLALLGLGVGLAVLSKGLIGIVLPGLVFLLWVAVMGRWRRVVDLVFSPAPLALLAVAAPWFILVERANPGFSEFFFVREHFARYATGEASRAGPFLTFVVAFLVGLLPWTACLGRALAPLWPPRAATLRARGDDLFFGLWILVVVLFFSFSQSKLVPYILPAFPAAALLAGRALAGAPRGPDGWLGRGLRRQAVLWSVAAPAVLALAVGAGWLHEALPIGLASFATLSLVAGAWIAARLERRGGDGLSAALAGWAGVLLALVASLPILAATESGHDLAVAAGRSGADDVIAFRCYLPSLSWTLEGPIPVAGESGELGSAGQRPRGLFLGRDEFWRRWNSTERLAVLARAQDEAEFSGHSTRSATVLARGGRYMILTNFPSPQNAPALPGSR